MSKFKNLILIFCLIVFVSCSNSSKVHNSENYPRVDGSTANMPMMASIRAKFLNEPKEEAENNTFVTTTDYAWRNLVEGNADLLLVYEPSEETKKIIEKSGVKLKITPIGLDALVFITNEDNSVENLTTEQIRDIYTNKITNWKDVGGDDKKIEAYQRVLNSGSQTLFLNLVMDGIKPVDLPTSYQVEGMDGLIEKIAEYNESANAIGYSVFYYAKKMYQVPGLKLLSVDGVMPTDDTIAKREYPYLNEYYLVIREDTEENSETMELYNFILSKAGKKVIKEAGYVPVE